MNLIYDGSYYGFINALKKAIKKDCEISKTPKNNLFDEDFNIETNPKEAKEFEQEISLISPFFLSRIRLLWLSEVRNFENIACGYLKQVFKHKEQAKNNIADYYISKTEKIAKKILCETHRFKGFIRFKEIEKNMLIAKIAPEHNILPLLKKHFSQRFSFSNFIIYDEKRKTAIFKTDDKCEIIKINDISSFQTAKEKEIQELWRIFFKTIEIKERRNEKLQKNKVPLKYRNNLTEFSD